MNQQTSPTYPQQPHPGNGHQQPAPPAVTQAERVRQTVRRLVSIKAECHNAVVPTLIRDRLREVIEALEYLLAGQIAVAQPNVVPGTPAGLLPDPTKTTVEFFSGPGAQQRVPPTVAGMPPVDPFAPPPVAATLPSAPITSGDVHFIPGPPPGAPGAVGGQTVEFYAGPAGTPYAAPAPNANGQTVEFIGGPPPAPPPPPSTAAAPAPAQPAGTVTNQPAQIIATQPTLTTEAGQAVLPVPGATAPPAADPNAPPPLDPVLAAALERARNILPIAEVVPVVPQGMPNLPRR